MVAVLADSVTAGASTEAVREDERKSQVQRAKTAPQVVAGMTAAETETVASERNRLRSSGMGQSSGPTHAVVTMETRRRPMEAKGATAAMKGRPRERRLERQRRREERRVVGAGIRHRRRKKVRGRARTLKARGSKGTAEVATHSSSECPLRRIECPATPSEQ